MSDRKRSRRYLLRTGLAAGSLLLAGCSGGESDGTATPPELDGTPGGESGQDGTTTRDGDGNTGSDSRPSTVVGRAVADSTLALVVQGSQRRSAIGGVTAAEGDEFVIVQLAVKNLTDDTALSLGDLENFSLQDDDGNSHSWRVIPSASGSIFATGLLVPGETLRGLVTFEVPEGTTPRELSFDVSMSAAALEGVTVDLTQRADRITVFSQDLRIPVREVGKRASEASIAATVESFRTTGTIGEVEAGEEFEFAVPEISVENNTDAEISFGLVGQLTVHDNRGSLYRIAKSATPQLDEEFPWTVQVPAGATRRGEVAYTVPVDLSPLYFAADLSAMGQETKLFWQLR